MKGSTKGMKLNRWHVKKQQQEYEALGGVKNRTKKVESAELRQHCKVKYRDTSTNTYPYAGRA